MQRYEQSLIIQTFSEKNHAKVEFFDMFIFNNVKSDLNIILCQPNKVAFKIKVLYL